MITKEPLQHTKQIEEPSTESSSSEFFTALSWDPFAELSNNSLGLQTTETDIFDSPAPQVDANLDLEGIDFTSIVGMTDLTFETASKPLDCAAPAPTTAEAAEMSASATAPAENHHRMAAAAAADVEPAPMQFDVPSPQIARKRAVDVPASLLCLPAAKFRAVLAETPLSEEEVAAIKRDRRRALNRSYQQASRQKQAALVGKNVAIMSEYGEAVRSLAKSYFPHTDVMAQFLEDMTELDHKFGIKRA